ncbi:MAG: GNAT family N-acetyltransferase [Oligoflexia bacterium]|nr:GNAT family N-acetyltransferase [Oligoflexia bacterium]
MSQSEYERYLERGIPEYARELAVSLKVPFETALPVAQSQFREMLPEGMNTKDHFFYAIVDPETDRPVGDLWFCVREKLGTRSLFIADFFIEEAVRGKGIGKAALRWLEGKARELNIPSIGLHVFGHNAGARQLYESLGYLPVSVVMRKDLSLTAT